MTSVVVALALAVGCSSDGPEGTITGVVPTATVRAGWMRGCMENDDVYGVVCVDIGDGTLTIAGRGLRPGSAVEIVGDRGRSVGLVVDGDGEIHAQDGIPIDGGIPYVMTATWDDDTTASVSVPAPPS
jgi:hypothetical protein